MPSTLTNDDWNTLLGHIKIGRCAPFLGAGACQGVLPLSSTIAREWASEEGFPLSDADNLPRVTQYIAVKNSPLIAKTKMVEKLKNGEPAFGDHDEPHRVLAELPLPIYITTNYDDFMTRALENAGKSPVRDYCRWNEYLQNFQTDSQWSDPKPASPVVYHLHGYNELPDSLVLTEDDYLDFLVNLTQKEDLIPPRIQQAMAGSALLFLGYALTDWDFRVVFRWLQNYLGRNIAPKHVSVQLVPDQNSLSEEEQESSRAYLNKYFDKMNISVYWGTCREFVRELKQRWATFGSA